MRLQAKEPKDRQRPFSLSFPFPEVVLFTVFAFLSPPFLQSTHKQSNMEDFQKEINTIRSLHCEYIVKYMGVCYSMGTKTHTLLEYMRTQTQMNTHNVFKKGCSHEHTERHTHTHTIHHHTTKTSILFHPGYICLTLSADRKSTRLNSSH